MKYVAKRKTNYDLAILDDDDRCNQKSNMKIEKKMEKDGMEKNHRTKREEEKKKNRNSFSNELTASIIENRNLFISKSNQMQLISLQITIKKNKLHLFLRSY